VIARDEGRARPLQENATSHVPLFHAFADGVLAHLESRRTPHENVVSIE
jgi:hypothetical protein